MTIRDTVYIGVSSKRWLGVGLLFIAIAGTSHAQTTQAARQMLIADQGQAGLLKIGMPFESLERTLRKKVQLHPAGTSQSGAMLEVSDLPRLGVSTLFGVPVEGIDVFFMENPQKQLIIEMFSLALPCSAIAGLEADFQRQTSGRLQTPGGLKYRVSKNGEFAFDLQTKPSCNAWIRHV